MQTLMEFAADSTAMGQRKSVRKKIPAFKTTELLWITAILTNFSGHNWNVVLGYTLPVQKLVGGDGSSDRIDVEEAVQVTLPVDGIPEEQRTDLGPNLPTACANTNPIFGFKNYCQYLLKKRSEKLELKRHGHINFCSLTYCPFPFRRKIYEGWSSIVIY